MYPVNQVILGNDPLFNTMDDIDTQIQKIENYKMRLQNLKDRQNSGSNNEFIWEKIDSEILPMTEEQRQKMMNNKEYFDTYSKIQNLVQTELLNLVKSKIENSVDGKKLLNRQLEIIRSIKKSIIDETNKELEIFNKFKEYSKSNPDVTYEEFIKSKL